MHWLSSFSNVSIEEGDGESDSLARRGEDVDVVELMPQRVSNKRKRKRTKFEEYLATDIQGGKSAAEVDLALERKLAKKLKVKAGKVRRDDDDINMLLDGIPSVLDSLEDKQIQNPEDYPQKSPKLKNSKFAEQEQKAKTRISSKIEASELLETSSPEVALENYPNTGPGKYVAPHLRSHGGNEYADNAQVRKRVRGLLNRLCETNVESITGEIATIFHSVGRIVGSQIISEEVIASCSSGPRGNEQLRISSLFFPRSFLFLLSLAFFCSQLHAHIRISSLFFPRSFLFLLSLAFFCSQLHAHSICKFSLFFLYVIIFCTSYLLNKSSLLERPIDFIN